MSNTIKMPIKLAPAPAPTNPVEERRNPGAIRMSPLMYGSLSYIASAHRNGTLNIDEVMSLKQTQLRSFKKHKWIAETDDKKGIHITDKGKKELREFTSNDQFFRKAVTMSFSSLLNLRLPGEIEPQHKPRRDRKPAQRAMTVREQQRAQRAS